MPNNRGLSLFIVEGHKEKKEILKLIVEAFPELDIDLDAGTLIWGTNFYDLIDAIETCYGSDCELCLEKESDSESVGDTCKSRTNIEDLVNEDIDLAWIIREKKTKFSNISENAIDIDALTKDNFINTVLVFDLEPHDAQFKEQTGKIRALQKIFSQIEDNGILYLNYPMVESFYFNEAENLDVFLTSTKKLVVTQPDENGSKWSSAFKKESESKGAIVKTAVRLPEDLIELCKQDNPESSFESAKLINDLLSVPYWGKDHPHNCDSALQIRHILHNFKLRCDIESYMKVGGRLFKELPFEPRENFRDCLTRIILRSS